MTDPLTDAVRRIKGLQEDVERLKAGQDEEGESRLLFAVQEAAVAADDVPDIREQTIDDGGVYSATYGTSSYNRPDSDTRRRRRS
jgi:hypothetical protein